MRKQTRRFLAGMILTAVMTLGTTFQALAARIAFSDPSTTTGQTVTVTMKITAADGENISNADVMLAYDASALEFVSGDGASGGAGALRVTGSSETPNNKELAFSLTFRAMRAGGSAITITSQEVYNSDSQLVDVGQQGTSTVTVAAAASDSTNANLAGLQISPGTLSPIFSPDVDTYTATVGGDVSSLVVDAPAVDSGASVSVSGNENLQIGENQIVCTVTAQDGHTVKTYTINVTKTADSEGAGAASDAGVVLKTPERTVTVRQVTEDVPIPEGFVPCSVAIDGNEVQGWVWGADRDNPQYCVFYATNESGENEFYRYDLTEKTLQRYFRDPADTGEGSEYAELADKYNSLLDDYNMRFYIIIGLIALAVVLLIVIIALMATRGGKDDFYEGKRDNSDYPQRRKAAQKQGEADRRRAAREERYRQVLAEEEAVRSSRSYQAEEQIRARQVQKRQTGQPPRQSGQTGQLPRQSSQTGQLPRQSGQTGQLPRQSGQQARPSGQARPSQGAQRPASQNYVVRGPLPREEEQRIAEEERRYQGNVQGRPQSRPASSGGSDDDFESVDLGI